MATNPMQKKARNAFLLGVVIMLIISLMVGLLLFLVLFKDKLGNKEEEERVEVKAYVLSQDVFSGQVVTPNLLTQTVVYSDMIPTNYVDPSLFSVMEMMDKDGNVVLTDENNQMYMMPNNIRTDINIDGAGYYKGSTQEGNKEYIEIVTVPMIAKIDLKKGAILTQSAITQDKERGKDDVRYTEFYNITLPTMLQVGEYVDVRITMPSGQNFIVASKKEVIYLDGDTIGFNLREDEIEMMDCAMVESYKILSTNMYVVKYIDAGIQVTATPTYPLNDQVIALINRNPNVVNEARTAIRDRQENSNYLRSQYVEPELQKYAEDANDNLEEAFEEQQEKAREARERYLSGLSGY